MIAIDGQANQQIAKIPAGFNIQARIWNPTDNKVYSQIGQVINFTVIDGATNRMITTIKVGDGPPQ